MGNTGSRGYITRNHSRSCGLKVFAKWLQQIHRKAKRYARTKQIMKPDWMRQIVCANYVVNATNRASIAHSSAMHVLIAVESPAYLFAHHPSENLSGLILYTLHGFASSSHLMWAVTNWVPEESRYSDETSLCGHLTRVKKVHDFDRWLMGAREMRSRREEDLADRGIGSWGGSRSWAGMGWTGAEGSRDNLWVEQKRWRPITCA